MINENMVKAINDNVTLAIRWGVGYRLIKPPYQSASDFEFIHGYKPPKDCIVVTVKNACGVINDYLKKHDIKEYSLKFGIVTFELVNGNVVLRYNQAGSDRPRKPRTFRRKRKSVSVNTFCQYLALKEKMDNHHLQELIRETKEEIIKIASDLNAEPLRLWISIFNDEIPMLNPTISRKLSVIEHYSNGTNKCNGCGANDLRVLTIDHINGDGNKHRKEINISGGDRFYAWLIDNNYPEGFQVLCWNCQMIKRLEKHEWAEVEE